MKVQVVIQSRGEKLFAAEAEIAGEGDLAEAAKTVFAAFYKANPGASLLDEHITVAFDKVPDANRT